MELDGESMLARQRATGDRLALDILDWLDTEGALTVEQLATLTDSSTAMLRRHIRALADTGMIRPCEEEPDCWRSTDATIDLPPSDDPEVAQVVRRAELALAQRAVDLIFDWESARACDRWAQWRSVGTRRDWVLPALTPSEVGALSDEIREVVEKYRNLATGRDEPEDAEPIFALSTAFPLRARAHR